MALPDKVGALSSPGININRPTSVTTFHNHRITIHTHTHTSETPRFTHKHTVILFPLLMCFTVYAVSFIKPRMQRGAIERDITHTANVKSSLEFESQRAMGANAYEFNSKSFIASHRCGTAKFVIILHQMQILCESKL